MDLTKKEQREDVTMKSYDFPSEGGYKRREKEFTDEELRDKLFEQNERGVTVGKERYKDSFVIKYDEKEYDFGGKARVASARLFHKAYPNMNLSAARDGKVMFGFEKDGRPLVKVFFVSRNEPYDISSSKFPQEIKNVLEPGEKEEVTDTNNLMQSPEKSTGMNVWVEDGGVKVNISENASREVRDFLEGIYEKIDYNKITLGINVFDQYVVRIFGKGKKFYKIDKTNGDVEDRSSSSKVPKTIKNALGKKLFEESMRLTDLGKSKETEIRELRAEREKASTSAEVRNFDERIDELEEEIENVEAEREAVEERMSLKERVKLIFKKHGLTALGIITAVGTVIGVVVSNLKSGLAKVAKGVGDGLKELGKKLAQLLPGMIGAIAKYVFDTAGEVIGYLAKNTWLLIVAAVVYAVEQFKKKNK